MNKIKHFLAIFKIWMLKRKADKLYKQTGLQHFVVKWCGKIIVIDKLQFKRNRQKGLFPRTFTATELKKVALYYTKGK